MDDFRTDYAKFSQALKTFFDEVSTQFKVGAPASLQRVKIIPTILAINDPALKSGDVNEVYKKFSDVVDATSYVFEFLTACVQDTHKNGVERQIKDLYFSMDSCTTGIFKARRLKKKSVTEMRGGVIYTNTGPPPSLDLEKIQTLVDLRDDIEKFARNNGWSKK